MAGRESLHRPCKEPKARSKEPKAVNTKVPKSQDESFSRYVPHESCDETLLEEDQTLHFQLCRAAYIAASTRVDRSLEASIATSCQTLVPRILEFFDLFQPESLRQFGYPPTLLPIAKLYCPSSVLDRRAICHHLHQKFVIQTQTNILDSQSAICLLQHHGPANSPIVTTRELMKSIVAQCIRQEETEGREYYAHLLRKRKRHVSYTDTLVEWAGATTKFDSIVVIVENGLETMSQATLDSFMAILTTLRAVHGVPISVVLCCVQVAHSSKVSSLPTSLLSGDAGLVAREFHAPTSTNLLGSFLSAIFLDEFITEYWQSAAFYCLDSDTRSQYIIMGAGDNQIRGEDVGRWCRCMMEFREIISLKVRMLQLLHHTLLPGKTFPIHLQLEGILNQSHAFTDMVDNLIDVIISLSPLKLLTLLGSLKDHLTETFSRLSSKSQSEELNLFFYKYLSDENPESYVPTIFAPLRDTLNQQIILHQTRITESESLDDDMERDMLISLGECVRDMCSIKSAGEDQMPPEDCFVLSRLFWCGNHSEIVLRDEQEDLFLNSISTQPRRDVSEALLQPLDHLVGSLQVPCGIFSLIDNHSISVKDWFLAFGNQTENTGAECSKEANVSDAWYSFAFAAHELAHCGLVSREQNKKEDSFQKTALVWSSGQ
eukprot:scaffold86880_cov51-Attheya_sp.AAC.1